MTDEYRSPQLWRQLLLSGNEELLSAVGEQDVRDAAVLARLRRTWEPHLVAAAIELIRARRKAEKKFPHPERLMVDVEGVEQATSYRVAGYKAQRFSAAGCESVHDLCCGIGGDAMGLVGVASVIAVDRDPLRAWMTEHNAGCETRCADVLDLDLRDTVLHIDPSRRSGERRHWRYENYRPGPEALQKLLRHNPDGAVKLGPGVDLEQLPGTEHREIELITESGALVQAVLWCGALALNPGQRTASRVDDGATLSGLPAAPPAHPDGRVEGFLFVADPAVERAGLLGPLATSLGLLEITPGLGVLTGQERMESPWLTGFEVLATLPWRTRRVREWLRAHDSGAVVVKVRGSVVDANLARRELAGEGRQRYTLFVMRLGPAAIAVVTRRL